MSNGLFAISKKGVWSPNFTDHQIVQSQNFSGPTKFQPLIYPGLPKENIHCIFLEENKPVHNQNLTAFMVA